MAARKIHVRPLRPDDIEALLTLESAKWTAVQAADGETLLARMAAFPELSIGAFCTESGTALASLFMRPIHPGIFASATHWGAAADVRNREAGQPQAKALFGISLSSDSAAAVEALFRYFYPRALKAGWKEIYLGSPIPGYRKMLASHPDMGVREYVHAKRSRHANCPLDPQLRYYHGKGFKDINSIHKDYFPHPESLDYGVILRRDVPLSSAASLWSRMPLGALKLLEACLYPLLK